MINLLEKIRTLKCLKEVDKSDLFHLKREYRTYNQSLVEYMGRGGFSYVFIVKGTIYGLFKAPSGFIERPNMLWFSHYTQEDNTLVISAQIFLSDILELLDEEIYDEIIFNLDILS